MLTAELGVADLVLDMEGYKMEAAPTVDSATADESAQADGGEELSGAGPSVLGLGLQGDLDEGELFWLTISLSFG